MQRRTYLLAVLVLVGGLAFTGTIVQLLHSANTAGDRAAFETNAQSAEHAVIERIETSIALLRGTAGLFASMEGTVTLDAFRAYMDRVALREQYPGILGIGFTRRILPEEREAVIARMRAEGHAGFRIWPEAQRDELHAILYLEPLDERNRTAIGYDMYANPVRRAAMERARDGGRASASGIVELVQEIDRHKQPGLLLYLPVYRGSVIPATIEERRERLVGFAYAPVRGGDFLSSAFADGGALVPFRVHAGPDERAPVIFESRIADVAASPRFTLTKTVDVAGQPWTFAFRSPRSLVSSLAVPALVATAGVLLSLAIAALLWRDGRYQAAIQEALEREQVARSQAERANRLKDDFLATLSHEMRTPLNAIVGWAAVLRLGNLGDADRVAGIEAIDRNAKAQARLIDDLLDMNRVMSGKLRMNPQPVDLAKVVEDAVDAILPAAQDKGVLVEKRLGAEPLIVQGDAARLQQVVWNLVSNAIKFTPAGGSVRLALERRGDRVSVEVADTGEGIPADFLPYVFDRFSQGDSTMTRHHGGLGIGLAIVRELVTLHGGTVRAQSPGPGCGATFVVDLPLARATEAGDAAVKPAATTLEGLKVLVVDDEADVRRLLQLVLEQRHATVRCAASAIEALGMLRDFRPDVVVSDIGMPGTNGYELMRRIAALPREQGGGVPGIALTAYARDEDRRDAFAAGYRRHLAKPVQPEALAAAVASLARAN